MAETASRRTTHRDPPALTVATVMLAALLAFLVARAVPLEGAPDPTPDGPGPAMTAGAASPAPPATDDDDTGEGEEPSVVAWNKYCKACHGTDGSPSPIGERMGAKDLRDGSVQARPDDEIRAAIAKGAGKMPGYEDQIPADQIDALVEFIRTLSQQ